MTPLPRNMAVMPPLSRNGSDDFQTPPEALLPLLPYLHPDWTIWECACGKGYLVEGLRQAGFKVIATDKKEGKDFLTWQPPDWQCLVSNIPYSLKNEFLARAYALGKPFAFLLPLTALESPSRQGLFQRHGIQVMVLNKRLHFETPNQTTSHPWFPVAWFCWGLGLPEQLMFVDPEMPSVPAGADPSGLAQDVRTPVLGESSATAALPDARPYTLLSEVQPQPVEWLWTDRIPLGELTVIDGDPAVNKSTLTLDLAARVSSGAAMPGGATSHPGGVLLLAAEDSLAKTLPLRLQAAEADLTRIAALNRDVTLPEDLTVIEATVGQINARLLVIDPLMAFLGPHACSDQSVRRALTPLKALAERANIAVLLVRHLTKGTGRHSLYRGSGSIGIIGATRSALLVARDPEDPSLRVVCHTKSNLGPLAPSLLFEPVSSEAGVVRVEWRDECEYTAEDLLTPPRKGGTKLEEAKGLLLALLADGAVEQSRIQAAAGEARIAYRTVERAKEALGIVSRRRGFGPGSVVLWQLGGGDDQRALTLHWSRP